MTSKLSKNPQSLSSNFVNKIFEGMKVELLESKNEKESKKENPTHSFRETNLVLQLIE